jgi:hypothetical protein
MKTSRRFMGNGSIFSYQFGDVGGIPDSILASDNRYIVVDCRSTRYYE